MNTSFAIGGNGAERVIDATEHEFQRVKALLHEQLVESFDLSKITRINRQQLAEEVRTMANTAVGNRKDLVQKIDRNRLMDELMDEIFGFGPLELLLKDPTVNDILVNDAKTVYVERRGKLELTNLQFADDQHLIRIIQKIVAKLGRRIDESSPMVDARLPDGSRVNAVIPPLALDGPTLSIRRFGADPLKIEDLLRFGTILPEMTQFVAAAVAARCSILFSGGTGAGKTTLLNAFSRATSRRKNASSRSKIRRNSFCSIVTASGWKRGRQIPKGSAPSRNATWFAIVCVCVPIASSSAKSAVPKCGTCCKP